MIYLSYVAATSRETGTTEMLVQMASPWKAADYRAITEKFEKFKQPEHHELRDAYSDVLLVLDNDVRGSMEFPPREKVCREARAHLLAGLKRTEYQQKNILENWDSAARAVAALSGQDPHALIA